MDDHYLMNPEQLLQGDVADIILDLENPLILEVGYPPSHGAQTLMISAGAFAMRRDRDAHHVGGRAVLRSDDEGNM